MGVIRIPVLMTWRQWEAYLRCLHDESSDPEDPVEQRADWCREVARERDPE